MIPFIKPLSDWIAFREVLRAQQSYRRSIWLAMADIFLLRVRVADEPMIDRC